MADRKLNLNIAANADALQKDLAGLIAQLNQLNSTAATFNATLVSGFTKAAIAQERLNQAAGQTLIIEERLNQAAIKTAADRAKADNAAIAGKEKLNQVAAQTLIAEEKVRKAATDRLIAEQKLEQQIKRTAAVAEQANKVQVEGAGGLLKGLQSNLFAINNLRFGIQSFGFIANGIFQSLVGSSIQLEQQLISIRGALAATNDITAGGKSIANPLERINKLAPSVNKAIAQVRKDSLELANVTSDDLIGVFQIISGEVGNIGANLNDAAKLTKAFGSSFSALGLPLAGARQEIVSILQGTIDQNSALAKALAINNTQIQQEKAKGTLVEFLLRKTEALAASQGLVAKTFGGVSSNILEIFQRLQESFGKVVLPPVVEQLTKVYESLQAAQPQIETFISNLTTGLVAIASQVGTVLNQFIPTIQGLFTTIGAIAQSSVPLLTVALNGVLLALSGIATVLNVTIVPLLEGANTGAGRFVITAGLLVVAVNSATAAFTALAFRLGFVGPIAQGLVASIKALITILRVQFAASVSSAVSTLKALLATLTTVNAAFVALAAVVAVGAIVAFTVALDASKKTVDAWKASVDSTGQNVTNFTKRLKELQDQQKAGTITAEGRKQLEGYKKLLADTAKDIPRQIKDIEDAVKNNKAFALFGLNEDEAKAEIKRLKQFQQDVVNTLDETAIAGQKAVNQGTLKQQFNVVSDNYYKEFQKGTQLAVTQAKAFVGVLQEEVELGIRSKESGLERLKALSQGEFLLKEDRVAAAKAATAIIDAETKKQTALIDASQSETQLKIKQGLLSEIDGINKLGELKAQAKQAEINGIDEKLKFVVKGSQVERDLLTQRKKAIADLQKGELEFVQEQITALRGGLERELSANDNLRRKAEAATQADILALKIGGFQNETELQEQSLLQKQRNTESEIADKRRVLEFEKTNLANFVGSQKEKEELILKIGNTEAELAKLQLDATDNLIARNKLIIEQKINILEIEKTTSDRVKQLLESQNSLLGAQAKLQTAIADARVKGAENKLTALKQADELLKANRDKSLAEEKKQRDEIRQSQLKGLDEEAKKRKEAEFAAEDALQAQADASKQANIDREKERITRQRLAELGVSAGTNELTIARQIFDQEQKILELKARKFEQEQANARRELEVQIQQSEIRDKQLQIEAKIALLRARESGNTDAIKAALELVTLTDEQVKNNKQIGTLQRQTLAETQKADRATFNQEQGNAAFKNLIEGADRGLTGIQSSEAIKARELPLAIADKDKAGKLLSDAKSPEKVKEIQEQRKKDLADVANGAVAFKDTTDKIQANFAALPDSLKATKIALQEVTAQAKELSENPIFKSREEQAAKQRQAEAQAQLQAKQQAAQKANISQRVANESAAIAGFNAATTAKNANIAKQNQIFGVVDKAIFNNSDAGIREQADNLRKLDFNQGTEEEYLNAVKNPDSPEAKQLNRRINQTQQRLLNFKKNVGGSDEDFAQLIKRRSLSRFTGGLAPADIPVTVNERGQEAVTNLQTLETSLIPNGERTVQFDAPSWVHNASETKQIGALGAFDSGKLPNLNFGAIASALRFSNTEVVRELRQLRSELTASMSRPNLINNFSNDPRPDLTAYRVQQQLLRV